MIRHRPQIGQTIDSTSLLPEYTYSTNNAPHVYQSALTSGEDEVNNVQVVEEGRFSKKYINTATTTDISQNAGGYLKRISINGGTVGVVMVCDNTTGETSNPIAVIAPASTATPARDHDYDLPLTAGLQVITQAATDITVIYRPSIDD